MLLGKIKVYGENAKPWIEPTVQWDFTSDQLAMNIYLPDPDLSGTLDWRAPYYFNKQPDALPAQPQVVDFLRNTAWVDFILAYLKGVRFAGLRAPSIPRKATKVALPACASFASALPTTPASPSTSRRSSLIWNARPSACP